MSPAPASLFSRWRRAPALRAALLQALAFAPTLLLVYLLARAGLGLSMPAVLLLQGALAALLSWRAGLASWWRAIQLLFPLSLYGALALQLPPWLFLLVFLFLVGLYWSTFRTQVPYYPSTPAVWDALRQLLPQRPGARLIDIGSGLGGLVRYLARLRPDAVCTGIELAPLPWLYSTLRARLAGSPARFILGDYEKLDFSRYELVFAYLSPAAMDALWAKASAEMLPGSVLVSYEFDIAARPPDRTITTTAGAPALFAWYF